MDVELEPGKYVVAVSGGVDSVTLLHMLAGQDKLPGKASHKFIVAHYDHGIRPDSAEDRRLVQKLAQKYGLPFVYQEGKLGPGTSEAAARAARYKFLHQTRRSSGARAIITAHHQDDLLETAIINLRRGTNRRGLSSLKSTDIVKRPLLGVSKRQLRAHAIYHKLDWREDSTNADETILRNYIRHRVLPKMSVAQRRQLIELIEQSAVRDRLIDAHLINYLHLQPHAGRITRASFNRLPHSVAREVLATWLRHSGVRQFDRRGLERLVAAAKTGRPGTKADVCQGCSLLIGKTRLKLQVAT